MWSNISSPLINNNLKNFNSIRSIKTPAPANSLDDDDQSAEDADSSNRHQWSQSQSSDGSCRENGITRFKNNSGSPLARYKHAVCAASSGYIYIYGGRCGNSPLDDDIWRFDPHQNSWIQIETTGYKPPSLQEHTLVEYNQQLYLFGGQVGTSKSYQSFWRLDLVTNEWHSLDMKSSKYGAYLGPTNRRGHSAVIYGDSMFIFGGFEDFRGSSAQLWEYNLVCERWELRNLSSTSACHPEPRHGHSAVVYGDSMLVYGGLSNLKSLNDLWRWSWRDKRWFKVRTKGKSPGYIHGHSAILAFDSMFVFGGERNGRMTRAVWRLNLANMVWHKIRPKGPQPSPTIWHGAVANPLGILDRTNYIVEGNADDTLLRGEEGNCFIDLTNDHSGQVVTDQGSNEQTNGMSHSKSVSNCTSSNFSQPKNLQQPTRIKKLKRLQMKFMRRNRNDQITQKLDSEMKQHIKSSASESDFVSQKRKAVEIETASDARKICMDVGNTESQTSCGEHSKKVDQQGNGKILDNLDCEIKEMFQQALTNDSDECNTRQQTDSMSNNNNPRPADGDLSITSSCSDYKTAIQLTGSMVSGMNGSDLRSRRTSYAYTTPPSEMVNQGASTITLTNRIPKKHISKLAPYAKRDNRPKSEILQSLIDRADDGIKQHFTPFFHRTDEVSRQNHTNNQLRTNYQNRLGSNNKKLSHRHSFTDKSKRHTIHQTMTYYNLYFSEDKYSSPSDESSENKPSSDESNQESSQRMDFSDEIEEDDTASSHLVRDFSSTTIKNYQHAQQLECSSGTLVGIRGGSRAERDSIESDSRTLCGELANSNTSANSLNGTGCSRTSQQASTPSHALTLRRDSQDEDSGRVRIEAAENESCDNTSLSFSVIAEFEEDDMLQYSSPTDPVLVQRSPRRNLANSRLDSTIEPVKPTQANTEPPTQSLVAHKSVSSGYESISTGLDQSARIANSLDNSNHTSEPANGQLFVPMDTRENSSFGGESSLAFASSTNNTSPSLDHSAVKQKWTPNCDTHRPTGANHMFELDKTGNSSTTAESLALNSDIESGSYAIASSDGDNLAYLNNSTTNATFKPENTLSQYAEQEQPNRVSSIVPKLKKSIFSKHKSKNRYWQLCMFVIGGKQGSPQGAVNEPITIWRLYI